jgi:hypothetical protein
MVQGYDRGEGDFNNTFRWYWQERTIRSSIIIKQKTTNNNNTYSGGAKETRVTICAGTTSSATREINNYLK